MDPLFRSTAEDEPGDQDQDQDQDEALSLRDLPLTSSRSSTAVDLDHHHTTTTSSSANHSRRSSSDPTADFFFEFLVSRDDDDHLVTSPADDVIFRGRLLPYFNPPPPRRSLSLSSAAARAALIGRPRRPETQTIRPSRSLDCRKLRRNSSSKAEIFSRNSSNNSRNTNSDPKTTLPWYWLVFGLPVRVPAEMDLKDIKSRQFRRNIPPASLFSGESERFSGGRRSSASWRLLSVLSCKSHASVDVMKTASFHDNSLICKNFKK